MTDILLVPGLWSSDDQYVTPGRARGFARAWGSRLVDVGPKGHINSASGLGTWPEGFASVEELRAAERDAR